MPITARARSTTVMAAPPMHLLAGHVRNAREARAMVSLDVHAVRQQAICDDLLACFAQEHELVRLHRLLAAGAVDYAKIRAGDDVKLRAAVPLVEFALATVRAGIRGLLSRADATLEHLAELRSELDWFRSANQSLVEELQGENCGPLAEAKEQLWLIEESLLRRVEGLLEPRRGAARAVLTEQLPTGRGVPAMWQTGSGTPT